MFKNLRAEMAREGITVKKMAETLNIPVNTLRDKIKGRTEISLSLAFTIRELFFPDIDIFYLFKKEE
jgi:plasmid maintenance system antidote protein VapI